MKNKFLSGWGLAVITSVITLPGVGQELYRFNYVLGSGNANPPASIIKIDGEYIISDRQNNLARIEVDGDLVWSRGTYTIKPPPASLKQNHRLERLLTEGPTEQLLVAGSYQGGDYDHPAYMKVDHSNGTLTDYRWVEETTGAIGVYYSHFGSQSPAQYSTCILTNFEEDIYFGGREDYTNSKTESTGNGAFICANLPSTDWGYTKAEYGRGIGALITDLCYDYTDDAVVAVGTTPIWASSNKNIMLSKTDNAGGFEWNYAVGVGSYDLEAHAIEWVGDGYLVVGEASIDYYGLHYGLAVKVVDTGGGGMVSWIKLYEVDELLEIEKMPNGTVVVLYNNNHQLTNDDNGGLMIISKTNGNISWVRNIEDVRFNDFIIDIDGYDTYYVLLGLDEEDDPADDRIVVYRMDAQFGLTCPGIDDTFILTDIYSYYGEVWDDGSKQLNDFYNGYGSSWPISASDDEVCCNFETDLVHNTVTYCIIEDQDEVEVDLEALMGLATAYPYPAYSYTYNFPGGPSMSSSTTAMFPITPNENLCYIFYVTVHDDEGCDGLVPVSFCVYYSGYMPRAQLYGPDVFCDDLTSVELPNGVEVDYFDEMSDPVSGDTIDPSALGPGSYTYTGAHHDYFTDCDLIIDYEFQIIDCNCSAGEISWGINVDGVNDVLTANLISGNPYAYGVDYAQWRYSIRPNGSPGNTWYMIGQGHNTSPFPFMYDYGPTFSPDNYDFKLEIWWRKLNEMEICGYWSDIIYDESLTRLARPGQLAEESTNKANAGSEISIYPNPSQGQYIITGLTSGTVLIIHDQLGKEVERMRVKSEQAYTFDLKAYRSGIYTVKIINGEHIDVRKIIKQ